ncbi:prolyl endopeptidase [Phlebotomus argentipes]|uniref:prolyl endopeptidase n=1 Tax=Phlebotomus argentipes TaxID=94469 RepID=UPI002892B371|nr:prolyl endopeptidase [Phlebotomus argentipes]
MPLKYPEARRDLSNTEEFFGRQITDHYRWLEDPDAAETEAFVSAQNEIAQPYLENNDEWKVINEKLTKLWNYPKYNCPLKYGNRYFFSHNSGLQNQNVLYTMDSLNGESKVFLDPNTLSEDGTVALSGTSFSEDGRFFAYGLSASGSDWIKIKIRNVETGKDFPEVLEKVKFSSMAWTKDCNGIFYGRYPDQEGKTDGSETLMNEHQKLYYHRVGTPQSEDVLVAEFPENPSYRIGANVSDCGKYLILLIVKDCRDNLVYFADLESAGQISGKLPLKQIIHKFEADYEYVTNTGSNVVFLTNKNAPNYHLVCIDFNDPAPEKWNVLVPEHKTDVLDWVECVHQNKLILGYIHDVKTQLQVHSLETGKLIRHFPIDVGTIVGCFGRKSSSEIFYQFVSFLTPGIIYHYDFADESKEPTVFRECKIQLEGFKPENYCVEQVFYPSRDGTKIPMFIVRKNTPSVTPRPCLQYGYGGFNISIQPTFSITGLMFVEYFNGVLAFPNIRGGGEYGEKWHNAGRLLNKQNVFDDFQAAAEYLVANKYTTKPQLAIQGASNGGLLVGACLLQRPDLFGAAVAQVGVLDMLRFHKFTIGHAWTSDYGDPDKKEHFDNLIKYSPLHNVKTPADEANQYPATLILTADHDDRVSPLHSLKFAATIQHAVKECEHQKNPILLRVYSKAGHGAGKPTTKKIEEATDILTFLSKGFQANQ